MLIYTVKAILIIIPSNWHFVWNNFGEFVADLNIILRV